VSFVSAAFAILYVVALALRAATRTASPVYVVGLLMLSWVFYAWHVPWYLALLVFVIGVAHVAARLIAATPTSSARTRLGLLVGSLAINLGLLGYFKYAGFLLESFAELSGRSNFTAPEIVLPIGISFFTFQAMSYTVDVYRGDIAAETSFLRLACYISFFPQLVAGPIVRAGTFLYQFERRRRLCWRVFAEGTYLIIRGLFLKVVVADNLGQIVDAHWGKAVAGDAPPLVALSVLVFFACQLYCDFAGYTDIARGLAYQLGFRLPINFNAPYLAATFTDFWRRWHITLSTWFRDYVYVPLGGNRHGRARAYSNLLLVMLVAGLWHGARWTFVIWGAVHGLAVAVERALGFARGPRTSLVVLVWFLVVQLTWIFSMGMFRAADAAQGWRIICNALSGIVAPTAGITASASEGLISWGWWLTLPVAALHARALLTERQVFGPPAVYERTVYAGAMLAAILALYPTTRQFIYFQF
jgi:alginate O-acetyltransferase complex protein AlgI